MKINVGCALHQDEVKEFLEKHENPTYTYLGTPNRVTLQFEVDEDDYPQDDYDDICDYTKAIIKKLPFASTIQVRVDKALF